MIKLIIKKELKEISLSAKFVYSFAVCTILIVLIFYVGAKNYQITKAQYDSAISENLRSMAGITDWRMVNHRIFLPPQPLALLVSGISNDIGRNIQVRGRGELIPTDSKYSEDPVYAVFRFLDLNFLFQIILSLFAILFCYNAINGEKERGTLRLIFSNALPRDKYIIGKVVGSFIAVALPLLIPILIGCLLLIVMGIPMTAEDWLKLALILFVGFLLFSVFMNLSVLVSIFTHHSATSFLVLLVVWIMFVLVIPKASVLIAGRAVNVPSVDEINYQKGKFARQASNEFGKALSAFKPSSNENAMKEFQSYMEKYSKEREERTRAFNEKVNKQRIIKQDIQESIALDISRISPSSSFTFASASLAGTSLDLIRQYREQAENYQKVFSKFQISKTGSTTGSGFSFFINDGKNKPKEINPKELPQFVYKAQPFSSALKGSLADIGLLLLFNILFFAGSYFKFLKFDLR